MKYESFERKKKQFRFINANKITQFNTTHFEYQIFFNLLRSFKEKQKREIARITTPQK